MKYKILTFFAVASIICTSCSAEKDTDKPTNNSTKSVANVATTEKAEQGEEVVEVKLSDLVEIKFDGISPFLRIKYEYKHSDLPQLQGSGSVDNAYLIAFDFGGGEKKGTAVEGDIYSNPPKCGDKLTFVVDAENTQIKVDKNNPLSLGSYTDTNGKTTKYILTENEITVSNDYEEYLYKPELWTKETDEFYYREKIEKRLIENTTADSLESAKIYLLNGKTKDWIYDGKTSIIYLVNCKSNLNIEKKNLTSGYFPLKIRSPLKSNLEENEEKNTGYKLGTTLTFSFDIFKNQELKTYSTVEEFESEVIEKLKSDYDIIELPNLKS
jgi:hypothetical protein